ncbi:MAG: phosphatidylserine decarboxylase family protein [Desulfurella sp.]|uniref:phosphatidylserine decarboxylase family protein n=1 Tax=Desulfurella sp. TaxID=1962857 RepID=UPI003CB48F6A
MKTTKKDPIAKEGYVFIASFALASLLIKNKYLKSALIGASAFSTYFFRNPKRQINYTENMVLSPADGTIVDIGKSYERFFFKSKVQKISIFMSVFNVHINLAPFKGVCLDKIYNKGLFISANKPKASIENEQCALLLENEQGQKIVVVQIAGIIARRIVTYTKPLDNMEAGDIIGLIRFGSRLDIYCEKELNLAVHLNQKVKGGDLIGYL